MKTTAQDAPLAEITLRKYEKPSKLSGRALVRKLCLSLGLLQPGDSRDVVVDVLFVILKGKKPLSCSQIEKKVIALRKKSKLPLHGIAGSNIRRHLRRLKDMFIIESIQNKYRRTEKLSMAEIFEEKIERYYLDSIKARVKEYCQKLP